jgi:hypothetical protein
MGEKVPEKSEVLLTPQTLNAAVTFIATVAIEGDYKPVRLEGMVTVYGRTKEGLYEELNIERLGTRKYQVVKRIFVEKPPVVPVA